ncbi:MAG: alpha/beta fold hydrolase [Bacteroidota bacterium]
MAKPSTVPFYYPDGSQNQLSFDLTSPSGPILLVLPALGMRASYYQPLQQALGKSGLSSVSVDWRGHGHSSLRPGRKQDWGYEQLVQDTQFVLETIGEVAPDRPVIILGHSLGGQIGSLVAARFGSVEAVVLVASCLVDYRGWTDATRYWIQIASRIFYPISLVVGHFPGPWFRFGGREARSVMYDWSSNGLTGLYRLKGSNFDYEGSLAHTNLPVLGITIEDDQLAPPKAMQGLLNKYGDKQLHTYHHIPARGAGEPDIDHFRWARHPGRVVAELKAWLTKTGF